MCPTRWIRAAERSAESYLEYAPEVNSKALPRQPLDAKGSEALNRTAVNPLGVFHSDTQLVLDYSTAATSDRGHAERHGQHPQ